MRRKAKGLVLHESALRALAKGRRAAFTRPLAISAVTLADAPWPGEILGQLGVKVEPFTFEDASSSSTRHAALGLAIRIGWDLLVDSDAAAATARAASVPVVKLQELELRARGIDGKP